MSSPVKPVEKLEVSTKSNSETKKEKRFILKKWNAVAMWSWDLQVENCAVCRNHINDLCIECQGSDSPPSEKCDIAWGVCNHAYHFHCISRWLKKQEVCPLDNQKWELLKYGK